MLAKDFIFMDIFEYFRKLTAFLISFLNHHSKCEFPLDYFGIENRN